MKHQRFYLVLLMTLMLCAGAALGQDSLGAQPKKTRTPADYRPQTLKEVADEEFRGPVGPNAEKTVVHGDLHPTRARATYTGRSRLLPQVKKEVLHRWAQLFAGAPDHYTVPYESEFFFKDKGIGYWLAVRKGSVPQLEKELKEGDEVDLFFVRLGGAVYDKKWESLLLVESFQKPEAGISSRKVHAPRNYTKIARTDLELFCEFVDRWLV